MWLARLDLLAYGRFTDVRLPLGPGFHLVYGPNEAGKSTTLRAIRQLLFGIDERTNDGFLHANTNLRIGGAICDDTGTPLEVIRRKGRKETLRGADDISVIDEAQWQQLLQGIDETTFTQRYGIDYEQLIKGGHEIATGSGDLGEILFATGSGVRDLAAVQQHLEDEASGLFKPKGTKQKLNLIITDWQKQRDKVAQCQLSIADWEEKDRQRQDARRRVDELTGKITSLNLRRRFKDAKPLVEELRQLESRWHALESIRQLPADFEARRQEALLRLNESETQTKATNESLKQLQDELAQLSIPVDLLSKTEELNRVFHHAGSIAKAHQDRSLIAQQYEQELKLVQQLRESQDLPADDVHISAAILDRALRTKLQQLGHQQAGLSQALVQAHERQQQLKTQISDVRLKLASLPATSISVELQTVVREARSEGDLEARFAALEQEITESETKLKHQLTELKPWDGSIRELKMVAVPNSKVIQRWDTEFETNRTERTLLESRLSELKKEHESASQRIQQLQQEFQIPTESDLVAARQQRDATWSEIRKQIQSKDLPSDSQINEFEQKLSLTDQLADRLRNEADRVAQLADHLADLKTNDTRQQELAVQIERWSQVKAALDQGWLSLWSELQMAPLSPREMQGWLARRELILQHEKHLSRRVAEAESLRQRMDLLAASLSEQLHPSGTQIQTESNGHSKTGHAKANAGSGVSSEQVTSRQQKSFGWDEEANLPASSQVERQPLSELLQSAEHRLNAQSANERNRQQAEETLTRFGSEEAELQRRIDEIGNQITKWGEQWRELMRALKLAPESTPETAVAYVETLFELMDHQKQADQLHGRMMAIDQDASQFKSDVKRICNQVAPDLVESNPDDAIKALQARLAGGVCDQVRYNELKSQEQRLIQKLDQSQKSQTEARRLVAELCDMAGLSDSRDPQSASQLKNLFQMLGHAAEQSKVKGDCESHLLKIRKHLGQLAEPEPIDTFIAQVEKQPTESILNSFNESAQQSNQLEAEREQVRNELAQIENQISQMTGSDEAADAEETLQQIQAQIHSHAEHYVRTKLASAVLKTAIERYRERIRGPVLTIASELFRELTLNSFDGLRVEDDEQNKPMLVGLRAGGRDSIPVTGMSEGTCDQLYLALRLASLQLEASPRNRLPFIVDDILIQFDDARAAAALRALSRFGQTRQVIYFTHHEHLLEIARQELKTECAIHRLDGC